MGMRLRNSCFSGRLSMKPGSMLFMRMFSAAYLSENSLVKAARPARNTPDAGNTGSGSKAAKVEMLMITDADAAEFLRQRPCRFRPP